jgi:NitT/TauT family transport system substrate-binding protein
VVVSESAETGPHDDDRRVLCVLAAMRRLSLHYLTIWSIIQSRRPAAERIQRISSTTGAGEYMRHHIRDMACGVLAVLTLATTIPALAQSVAPKLKMVFSSSSATLVLPLYVAEKKGWLDIEPTFVSGDANAVRALLSGTADIAIVGDFNVYAAIGQGAKVKAISSWQSINDYNLIVTDKIAGLQDLSGKIFAGTGPGGPPEEFSKMLFKKHHVDGVKYIAVSGGHANILQALIAGRADGGLVNTLTAVQGAKGGKVKVLTAMAKEYPELGYCYNIVREETLADPKRKAQLEQFALGGIKAVRFIAEHPDEAADILRERVPDLDPAVAKDVVRKLSKDGVWGINGGIEEPAVEATLDVFRKTGMLKGNVSAAQVIDAHFVSDAIAKLGKN